MKTVITVLAFLVLCNTALAESHGGVMRSNAGFEAVTKYALEEGGSLSRVLSIQKSYKSQCAKGDVYKITWGGMDFNGVEHADPNPTFVIAIVSGDALKTKVKLLKSAVCPK